MYFKLEILETIVNNKRKKNVSVSQKREGFGGAWLENDFSIPSSEKRKDTEEFFACNIIQ